MRAKSMTGASSVASIMYAILLTINLLLKTYRWQLWPSIAQLVERRTVEVRLASLGRWFESGSKDSTFLTFFNHFLFPAFIIIPFNFSLIKYFPYWKWQYSCIYFELQYKTASLQYHISSQGYRLYSILNEKNRIAKNTSQNSLKLNIGTPS